MKFLRVCAYSADVAKIFGVHSAVLLATLDNLLNIARVNGDCSGRVLVSREDIYETTAIDEKSQLAAENILSSIGVLSVTPAKNSKRLSYSIDEKKLREVLLSNVSIVGLCTQEAPKEKTTKKREQGSRVKKAIDYGDEQVDEKLKSWLSSLYEIGKGGLSKESVCMQQEELKKFSKGNNAVAIEVINIAIKNGWRNLEWAIRRYQETNNKNNSYNFSNYNNIKSSRDDNLSEEVF